MRQVARQEDVILKTERLTVRPFTLHDADFILKLLNEKGFMKNIGDKKVRNLEDAKHYLREGPIPSFQRFGIGLWRVGLQDSDISIGMAGLLKRDQLENVDLGYALLAKYQGCGYALEVTSAVMKYARERLDYHKIVALVDVGNEQSIRLLDKLGFIYERMVQLTKDDKRVQLFVSVPASNTYQKNSANREYPE